MATPSEDAVFGGWLRRRRKALDLTQKELARRVGCSPATIRKLEADERRPSKHVAASLARVLGVAGVERDAFVRFARSGWADAPPPGAATDMDRPWLEVLGRADPPAPIAPTGTPPAPGATMPAAPGADEAPRFLAREAELARLDAALRAAHAGHGGVLLLSGDAGQGKTSLMTAFAARSVDAYPDLLAVTGSCNAYTGRGDAFAPFREILRQLTGEEPPATAEVRYDATLRARLGAFAPRTATALLEYGPHLLETFVPARLVRVPNGAPDPAGTVLDLGTASAGDAALRAEAIAVLARLTSEAPLLLMLDDLQWADPSSLELLLQLARVTARQRLLVLGAFRPTGPEPTDTPSTHALDRAVRELKRLFGEVVIDLGNADARAFLDAWIDSEPNDLDAAFREALWQQTAGQPLFTIELLRAMQARGDLLQNAAGRWVQAAELRWDALPSRVAGALGDRIGRLEAEAAAVLRVAAVEGEVFTAEVVARVLGIAPLDLARLLGDVLDRSFRLVAAVDVRRTAQGQRVSRHRFRHNLIQRYVLEQIGGSEQGYLHEAVADATLELLGDEADPLAVAYHLREAQAPAAAAPFLYRAGQRARRAGALAEAVDAYREAAEFWPGDDIAGRAAVLRDLGQSLYLSGERDEATATLERAWSGFEQAGDAQAAAAARALLINVEFDRRPEDAPALQAYQQALTVLESLPGGGESPETARVLALMAPRYVAEDGAKALALAERALGIAERTGAEDERLIALVTFGDILADMVPERRDEGQAMMEEGLEQARQRNVMEAMIYASGCLANLHTGLGRVDRAIDAWNQMLGLAETHGVQLPQRTIPAQLFELEWRAGRWRAALERQDHLRRNAERHPFPAAVLAAAMLDLGRTDDARELMVPWVDDLPRELLLHYRARADNPRLRVAAALGEADRADRLALGFLAALDRHAAYQHQVVETTLTAVSWLAARTDPAAPAATSTALSLLEATARHWGAPRLEAVHRSAVGIVAWHDGHIPQAASLLTEAADVWRTAGAPLAEARAHSAAALALRAAGEAGADDERAHAAGLLEGLAAQLPEGELARSFADERGRLLRAPLTLP